MNWFSKIIGEKTQILPEKVDSAWAQRIEAFLSGLDHLPEGKGRSGLAHDIYAYLLHGEPQSVLSEVATNKTIGEHLKVSGYHRFSMSGLYEGFPSLPVAIALRWAYLLRAAACADPHFLFYFQSPQDISWAEILILHASGFRFGSWPPATPKFSGLTMESLERLFAAIGQSPEALLVSAFATPVSSQYGAESRLQIVSYFGDFSQTLKRYADAVHPLLLTSDLQQRLHFLTLLSRATDDALADFAPELCEWGGVSSRQVRAAALPLILRCGAAAIEPLKGGAIKGRPEQREHSLSILWSLAATLADAPLQSSLREWAGADKAPRVQALVALWDAALQPAATTIAPNAVPLPEIDWQGGAPAEISPLLDRFTSALNTLIASHNRQSREFHQRRLAQGHKSTLHEEMEFSKSSQESLRNYLVAAEIQCPYPNPIKRTGWYAGQIIEKMAIEPVMTPVLLLKFLLFFDQIVSEQNKLDHSVITSLNLSHRAKGHPTLLELRVMLKEMGYPDPAAKILTAYCSTYNALADDWSVDAVAPFFSQHQELLHQELSTKQSDNYAFDRKRLFAAIASLPRPSAPLVKTLFILALGSGKIDRPLAQAALERVPGKEENIILALSDGKAETRTIAAQWLGRLRYRPAIAALEGAVRKEKNDVAKGALLDALQHLGEPLERYLDRQTLATEAELAVAKGLPKDLDWFPWDALPALRWGDSGEEVPAAVVRWMIIQAVKQRSPEPGAVLRKYCAMFQPRDREKLGQFLLEIWLRHDILPIPAEEAETRALAQAQSIYAHMRQYPQYFQEDPHFNASVEELRALYLPRFLRQPVGSAIGSKGVLAMAGACAGEQAATSVARYLKEYYGTRAAQGKVLIAMLAWIEHPSATQLMLSIGSRFRTKGFQEEATRQAEALAERKGWTLAELADRTIPSAGFDEQGDLELNFGPRVFTAKLLPDLKIELCNPEGKTIAALPDPRASDDAELAGDAKKAFAAARKEIKTIVALQSERLYEALCTEREWSFADWDLYLNRHPVMRRLVQRLVWVQTEEGQTCATFRPLEDGTLTDVEDNELRLPDAARIRLAHDSLLSGDDLRRWQQHLIDYEITPLFQQLGKGSDPLALDRQHTEMIADFEGHLLESFALRGRAEKLGYQRGQAGDGGWISEYEKRFPTLGLTAVIEFSGTPAVQEKHTVALLNLSFCSANSHGWSRSRMALAKVPPILLSECFHDLRSLAAEGPGFDQEWRKKVEY